MRLIPEGFESFLIKISINYCIIPSTIWPIFSEFFVFCRLITARSIHQRCSFKIDVLKNFAKFTGKHLC